MKVVYEKTERRKGLEDKILRIFEAMREMREIKREEAIGKNSIKRIILLNDENEKVSINTVKRIINDLLEREIIECVNPGNKVGLMFKLKEG